MCQLSCPCALCPDSCNHSHFAARHATHQLIDGVAEVARVASATPEAVSIREWDKGKIAAGRDDLPAPRTPCPAGESDCPGRPVLLLAFTLPASGSKRIRG